MSNDEAKNGIRRLLGKFLFLLLVLAVVCIVVLTLLFPEQMNLDALRRSFTYWGVDSSHADFEFDSHNSNCYANFDGGLAVASVGGLNTYQSNGEEVVISQGQLSLPQIESSDKLVMAYDVGGTTLLAVNNRSGEVLRVTAEKAILDADLAENGSICYLSGESGYKSVLTVYNNQQERIYRWLSSTTYLPLCAISPDGSRLAAVGLTQENGTFKSTLNFFRTDKEAIDNTVDLGNELIYDLIYLEEDAICAIGESGVQFLNGQGNPLGQYDYNGSYLKDFDAGGDGFLTLSMNMYRAGNRYTLVTVDQTGQMLASQYLGQEILDLSACGKYIAVLTTEGLRVYTRQLELYAETVETGAATHVLMRRDGSVLLLGGGSGHLFIP